VNCLITIDALLAATAKVHRMALATRNISHVADLGVDDVNPFKPPAGRP
jgi:predicted nucleic acid-binding protein